MAKNGRMHFGLHALLGAVYEQRAATGKLPNDSAPLPLLGTFCDRRKNRLKFGVNSRFVQF